MKYERLTARSPKNNMAYLANVKPDEQIVESNYPNTLRCIMESFERLAQYEDTGLTPEQVQEMKGKQTSKKLRYAACSACGWVTDRSEEGE